MNVYRYHKVGRTITIYMGSNQGSNREFLILLWHYEKHEHLDSTPKINSPFESTNNMFFLTTQHRLIIRSFDPFLNKTFHQFELRIL